MKRLLIFAALIVAIGSIGGNSLIAHAQTLTPSQTAALEQQLQVAKATLVNLEMQAGMVPTGDSGSASQPTAVATPVATTELSTNEVSALRGTLSTLAAMLTQLNSSLAVNSTLTSAQQQVVQNTLTGMQSTLVAMANTITSAGSLSASAPVATTQPSSPIATNPSPSKSVAVNTPTTATTPAVTAAPAAQNTPAATAPQTAQASSFWSFTKAHWPTIVIILLVIAILAILFWPEKEAVRTVSTVTSGSGKPKSAPSPASSTVTFSQSTAPAPAKTPNSSPAPATPVANAVAAPSQK